MSSDIDTILRERCTLKFAQELENERKKQATEEKNRQQAELKLVAEQKKAEEKKLQAIKVEEEKQKKAAVESQKKILNDLKATLTSYYKTEQKLLTQIWEEKLKVCNKNKVDQLKKEQQKITSFYTMPNVTTVKGDVIEVIAPLPDDEKQKLFEVLKRRQSNFQKNIDHIKQKQSTEYLRYEDQPEYIELFDQNININPTSTTTTSTIAKPQALKTSSIPKPIAPKPIATKLQAPKPTAPKLPAPKLPAPKLPAPKLQQVPVSPKLKAATPPPPPPVKIQQKKPSSPPPQYNEPTQVQVPGKIQIPTKFTQNVEEIYYSTIADHPDCGQIKDPETNQLIPKEKYIFLKHANYCCPKPATYYSATKNECYKEEEYQNIKRPHILYNEKKLPTNKFM